MDRQKTIHEKWAEDEITIISPNPIVKIIYKDEFFDFDSMKNGSKIITTITDDGIVVVKEYKAGSRKAHSIRTTSCSVMAFRTLCKRLENCIDSSNQWKIYVDDRSEELKLFYKFNRVQIVDRGLGNDDINIGVIMHDFLSKLYLQKISMSISCIT